MTETYKKAVVYLDVLPAKYEISDFVGCSEEKFCSIEKLQSILLARLMAEIYGKRVKYTEFLHYNTEKNDFFLKNDVKHQDGYLRSGEYNLRSDIGYLESPLYDILSAVFTSDTWQIDYLLGNVDEAYCCFTYDNENEVALRTNIAMEHDDDELDKIFSSRTPTEKLKDFFIEEFFSEDEGNPVLELSFDKLSSYFPYDSCGMRSFYILIGSKLLAKYYYKLNRKMLSKEDKKTCRLIDRCVNYLEIGSSRLTWKHKSLENVYFVFDMSCDYESGYMNAEQVYGLAAMDPRITLVPYLIDESIRYLDSKYHFIGG